MHRRLTNRSIQKPICTNQFVLGSGQSSQVTGRSRSSLMLLFGQGLGAAQSGETYARVLRLAPAKSAARLAALLSHSSARSSDTPQQCSPSVAPRLARRFRITWLGGHSPSINPSTVRRRHLRSSANGIFSRPPTALLKLLAETIHVRTSMSPSAPPPAAPRPHAERQPSSPTS